MKLVNCKSQAERCSDSLRSLKFKELSGTATAMGRRVAYRYTCTVKCCVSLHTLTYTLVRPVPGNHKKKLNKKYSSTSNVALNRASLLKYSIIASLYLPVYGSISDPIAIGRSLISRKFGVFS